MTYVGIDLHSDCFTCCYLSDRSKKKFITYKLTNEDISAFKKTVSKKTSVMVEASTNTFKFAERIQSSVKEVVIANTFKLKLISLVKKKTDKIDAEKLAIVLKMKVQSKEEMFTPVYLPEKEIQQLRSCLSTYRLLRKHIVSLKNRIHSIYKQNLMPFTKTYIFGKKNREKLQEINIDPVTDFQLRLLFLDLKKKEDSIKELEEYVLYLGQAYKRQIAILTSMHGISVFIAIAIIADIARIDRFKSSKKLCAYLRSAPGISSSNETVRNLSTNKHGRKVAVTMLCQSLNHLRDGNPKLLHWYENKVETGKKKCIIRMALCRRVISEIYQMLKKGEYHYCRNEALHRKKMLKYQKFLEKYSPGERFKIKEYFAA
jgi:transposase